MPEPQIAQRIKLPGGGHYTIYKPVPPEEKETVIYPRRTKNVSQTAPQYQTRRNAGADELNLYPEEPNAKR